VNAKVIQNGMKEDDTLAMCKTKIEEETGPQPEPDGDSLGVLCGHVYFSVREIMISSGIDS
jgi:hypothetical protein